MQIPIKSPHSLGEIVKASRKSLGLRQDDAAGSIGVSENFLGKVEKGSDSVTWGKLFQVLDGLGIHLSADVTEATAIRLGITIYDAGDTISIRPGLGQPNTINDDVVQVNNVKKTTHQ